MATIDPTRRAVVHWNDFEDPGPDGARLSVAWLEENNREMAYDFRGRHAYWMIQAFKARDARIKALQVERDRLHADIIRMHRVLKEISAAIAVEFSGAAVIDAASEPRQPR